MKIDILLVSQPDPLVPYRWTYSNSYIDSSRIVFFAHQIFANKGRDETPDFSILGHDSADEKGIEKTLIVCTDMLPKMREAGLSYVTLPYRFDDYEGDLFSPGRIHIVADRITGVGLSDASNPASTDKGFRSGFARDLLSPKARISLGSNCYYVDVDCSPFRASLAVKRVKKAHPNP